MDEVKLLPQPPTRATSKRARSSLSTRERDGYKSRKDQNTRASSASAGSSPQSTKPSLNRISSAPPLPILPTDKDAKLLTIDDDSSLDNGDYENRDSVASIKDDPFFWNYQSPNSVNLARELRSVSSSRDEEDLPEDPPPRSSQRPSVGDTVGSTMYPVCATK